jgi:hypothetical protein
MQPVQGCGSGVAQQAEGGQLEMCHIVAHIHQPRCTAPQTAP